MKKNLDRTNNGIVFLDNCAIGTELKEGFTRKDLEDDLASFRRISGMLSGMDNWLTVPEVMTEYNNGHKYLFAIKQVRRNDYDKNGLNPHISSSRKIKRTKRKNKKIVDLVADTTSYSEERRDFGRVFLEAPERDAVANMVGGMSQRYDHFLDRANLCFTKNGGETSGLNTDCKLIAAALTYAEGSKLETDQKVYMYSFDWTLARTFAQMANNTDDSFVATYLINRKMDVIPTYKISA